ncbi:hypothetical protein LDP10_02480 [Buchnera aphidicola (Pemphigus obesinymphae)]|uniref:hypothetical protein n=1 Tax=Buchnera aphidicola TaxID=9 RepID=UPI00223877D4|nr:hypothetical protein [Buchnera aphidicola]MCW5196797.1 hypothetical protein [Buchnera aphidicola (Pemphigus obesinymphae)]
MSSVSFTSQTQFLDLKNKIRIEENKKIKAYIKNKDVKDSSSISLQKDTSVNLISENKSDLYSISFSNKPLVKRHLTVKKNISRYNSSNADILKIKKYISDFILEDSTHKFISLTSTEINKQNNKVTRVAKKLINLGELTLNSSISFTKKIIHKFIHRFNKPSINQIFDEKMINQILQQKDGISKNKNHVNKIKSTDDINSNNILPEKNNSINNASFYEPEYQKEIFVGEKQKYLIVWKPLKKLNSSVQAANFANQYQDNFYRLKNTNKLDKNFIYIGDNSLFTVNGNKVYKSSPMTMLHSFKKIIPNLESRQLLSAYLHPDIFTQAYYDVYSRHPDLSECEQKRPVISYNVQELNNGKFEITAKNTAELIPLDENSVSKYNILGIKTSILLSKNSEPEITYSAFIE